MFTLCIWLKRVCVDDLTFLPRYEQGEEWGAFSSCLCIWIFGKNSGKETMYRKCWKESANIFRAMRCMKSVYKKISRLHCSMDAFIKWLYNSIYCFECVRKAKFSLKIQLHTTKYNTYYMLVNSNFFLSLSRYKNTWICYQIDSSQRARVWSCRTWSSLTQSILTDGLSIETVPLQCTRSMAEQYIRCKIAGVASLIWIEFNHLIKCSRSPQLDHLIETQFTWKACRHLMHLIHLGCSEYCNSMQNEINVIEDERIRSLKSCTIG